jgi:ribonucleoside-diphosphate reductase beta chain
MLNISICRRCAEIIKLEDDFIEFIFSDGSMEGLDKHDLKRYIRYVATARLQQLGIPNNMARSYIEVETVNPLPWLDEILNGQEFTNFFENRSTEYTKASMTGDWGDAFGG